jgi:hypothetical protein
MRPIGIDEANQRMTFVIEDPTNESMIKKIMHYISPYQADFMLMG